MFEELDDRFGTDAAQRVDNKLDSLMEKGPSACTPEAKLDIARSVVRRLEARGRPLVFVCRHLQYFFKRAASGVAEQRANLALSVCLSDLTHFSVKRVPCECL